MFVEQSVLSYITDLSLKVILGSRESGLSHFSCFIINIVLNFYII